ncbi:DUF2147 domain-containing protein [Arcicella rosea]|uniref:Uncharacterized protein (DUF2147 family) n=1 Tax=Arcicella rosea TaxID=502909 RepID=A0A841EQC9_9BACT|nr:DUF2147 domain-containing protein [Arcicella rosea]MBB6005465.1 uncharacterized protein (DUF2147 family) [Arcicella rosea]
MKFHKLLPLLFLLCSFKSNNDSEEIVGVWFTQDKASKIQIFKHDNLYFGKIVWLKSPTINGKTILDVKNPEEKLRSRAVLGLSIFNRFVFEGNNNWTKGEIYDVRTGRTVSGKLSLKNKNTLDVRGFLGSPIFGKTVTLIRAE